MFKGKYLTCQEKQKRSYTVMYSLGNGLYNMKY